MLRPWMQRAARDVARLFASPTGAVSIAYFAFLAAAVSLASTVCRARNSGGGLEMKALDAALVKRLNAAIADGSFAGFDSSPENLRIKEGTMAFASGPAVERAAEISAEDADSVGSAIRTE